MAVLYSQSVAIPRQPLNVNQTYHEVMHAASFVHPSIQATCCAAVSVSQDAISRLLSGDAMTPAARMRASSGVVIVENCMLAYVCSLRVRSIESSYAFAASYDASVLRDENSWRSTRRIYRNYSILGAE